MSDFVHWEVIVKKVKNFYLQKLRCREFGRSFHWNFRQLGRLLRQKYAQWGLGSGRPRGVCGLTAESAGVGDSGQGDAESGGAVGLEGLLEVHVVRLDLLAVL